MRAAGRWWFRRQVVAGRDQPYRRISFDWATVPNPCRRELRVLIGYARCPTDTQDLAAQRDALRQLGVSDERVYLDHGMTGRNRRRPGLQQALAAVREGDTLVVPQARPARAIGARRASNRRLPVGGRRAPIDRRDRL
jgi:hypothetical protein